MPKTKAYETTKIEGLGTRLKQSRERLRLSQATVAGLLQLSTSVLSDYETGNRTPSVVILMKLADTYKVSTDYLLGLTKSTGINTDGMTEEQIFALNHLIQTMKS